MLATPTLRALILNRAHHCLLIGGEGDAAYRVPEIPSPPERPLAAITAHVRDALGITLPSPAGSRVPPDARGPRDFVFLIDSPPAPNPPDRAPSLWAPLPRALALTHDSGHDAFIWDLYTDRLLAGFQPPTRDIDIFSFGDAPEMAAKLAHLVISGDKRGTVCWIRAVRRQGLPLPTPGLVSIVTDGFGYPRCVIRTEEVRILRFDAADRALAALEGEGDLTLEDWREGHLDFFHREAETIAARFDDAEEILAERFRVLHIIGRSDGAPIPP